MSVQNRWELSDVRERIQATIIPSTTVYYLMNKDEAKRVNEVLRGMKWVGNETGYLGPYDWAGYEDHKEKTEKGSNGLVSEIERELAKQDMLVSRIESTTLGLSGSIMGVITSLEESHLRRQVEMLSRGQRGEGCD